MKNLGDLDLDLIKNTTKRNKEFIPVFHPDNTVKGSWDIIGLFFLIY
jgi:hypothetical protein